MSGSEQQQQQQQQEEPAPKRFRPATDVVFVEGNPADPYNPSSVPIYQTATFKQTSATAMGEYDYTRSGNPTRTQLGLKLFNFTFRFDFEPVSISQSCPPHPPKK